MKLKKKKCRICNKECYLFSKGRCKPCAMKEDKDKYELKPAPIKPSSKPINKISKKQSERLRKYMKLREEYLKEHPLCEVCNNRPATDIHHKALRMGDNLFNHFLAVDRECHSWIHQNPSEARERGFLI